MVLKFCGFQNRKGHDSTNFFSFFLSADKEFRASMFQIITNIIDDLQTSVHPNPLYAKRLAYAFSYFMDWSLSILDKDFCLELIKLYNYKLIRAIKERAWILKLLVSYEPR